MARKKKKKNNKKKPWNDKDVLWAKAKRLCRLNVEDVRMAKELGMNPRTLIKNIPSQSQPWKAPVKLWVRDLYEKRKEKAARKKQKAANGDGVPESRRSDANAGDEKGPLPKRAIRPAKDAFAQPADEDFDIDPGDLADEDEMHPWLGVRDVDELLDEAEREGWSEDETFRTLEEFDFWDSRRPPTRKEIAEQNEVQIRLQERFRTAAECVADALSRVSEVAKVVLFGSVAVPLKKEVPRFRKFRRSGIAVWHECRDVDLAVWVEDVNCAGELRKVRNRALSGLYQETGRGVAPHQVELFLFDAVSEVYMGRVCDYNKCPKGKPDCRVPKCGESLFLQQFKDFTIDRKALPPDRTIILFNRSHEPYPDDLPF